MCSELGGDPPLPGPVFVEPSSESFVTSHSPARDPSPSLRWRLPEIPLGKGPPSALRVSGLWDEAGGRWVGRGGRRVLGAESGL